MVTHADLLQRRQGEINAQQQQQQDQQQQQNLQRNVPQQQGNVEGQPQQPLLQQALQQIPVRKAMKKIKEISRKDLKKNIQNRHELLYLFKRIASKQDKSIQVSGSYHSLNASQKKKRTDEAMQKREYYNDIAEFMNTRPQGPEPEEPVDGNMFKRRVKALLDINPDSFHIADDAAFVSNLKHNYDLIRLGDKVGRDLDKIMRGQAQVELDEKTRSDIVQKLAMLREGRS